MLPSHTYKNSVALLGSVIFFAWGEPLFVFGLIISTYIDYRISLLIAPNSALKQKTKCLVLSIAIIINTGILISSKYLTFICSALTLPLEAYLHIKITSPNLPLILGISFITFHKISYLVDSYKGRATPPRHFFDCALYIFLFPQLIAGPIIRYHDIGTQIHYREHSATDFLVGFFRFTIGLIKKLLIADPLGGAADQIFSFTPNHISTLFAWGGILSYTLQIYFDFSAYSDMAIGLGRMMGFRFPENFNRPYTSKSITEFWNRWHISLSNWMRIYLYIPLGGNRVSIPRTYLNLWIVFLISGIWHGASWSFVVWGAYYGFFLSIERLFMASQHLSKLILPSAIRQILTLFIIMIGWVFFRSPSLSYAINYLSLLFGLTSTSPITPWGMIFSTQTLITLCIALSLATLPLPSKSTISHPQSILAAWNQHTIHAGGVKFLSLHFILTIPLLILSCAAIFSSDDVPFLYFRF
ncbi:MAG: MBOAT family protein [Gammaproteobacteria bacterium]|nr:MBOAT family protein [Gammaproteobacteria bacterium]